MAIHPELVAPADQPIPSRARVEAWTVSQAADALAGTSISSPPPRTPRGTSVTIDIPLDEHVVQDEPPRPRSEAVHTVYKRREPIRRDSMKRREALLKGKEGSRRRQRWENDRLISNPYAEPPLPSDWQVQPTYPVHRVPYFLAPLWDAEYAKSQTQRQKRAEAARAPASKAEGEAAKVARELRTKLKRAKGAKLLLQDLETEVRGFVEQWERKQQEMEDDGLIDLSSEDEEEIVFVGRDGSMSDRRRQDKERYTLEKDKLIFQSLVDDHGAAFGRYLVHSIAAYICSIKTLAAQDRWPKPVEAQKQDLNFLVDSIHEEYNAWQTDKALDAPTPGSLLDMLRMLSSQLDVLESDREVWWTSPEKRALRQRLEHECDQKKLSELHKINNTTNSSIQALSAKLGAFCKWSPGIKGGV